MQALQAHCRMASAGLRISLGRIVSHIWVTFLDKEGRDLDVPVILGQGRLIAPRLVDDGIG